MEKIQYCPALPGCCYFCHSSNREGYVDTKQSIDFYGAVYICDACIMEMAHLFGMLSSDTRDIYEAKLRTLEEENFDLKVKITGLEQAIDGLRIAGRIPGPDPVRVSNVDSENGNSESEQRTPELDSGAGTDDEQGDDEGVGDLRSDEQQPERPSFSLNI